MSGGSGERHAAAGTAGAAKRGMPETPTRLVLRRRQVCRLSPGLTLRNACRAGFAGRGTTVAPVIEAHARSPSRPETQSRVARLAQAIGGSKRDVHPTSQSIGIDAE